MENWFRYVNALVTILIAISLGYVVVTRTDDIMIRQKKITEEISRVSPLSEKTIPVMIDVAKFMQAPVQAPVLDAREQLRKELLKTPFNRQYVFLDSKQVDKEYEKVGEKAILTSAEIEYTQALERSGTLGFREFLKSEIGEETVKKVRQSFAMVAKGPSSKYEELEAFAIQKDLVVFGIENLQIAAEKVENFAAVTRDLQEQFGFQLDASTVAEHKRRLAEEAMPELVSSLQTGSRNVLIRGGFSVLKSEDDNVAIFTFDHPLNQHFALSKKLIFRFAVPLKDLDEAWRTRLRKDTVFQLAAFGVLVPNFSETEFRWDIIPLAVYLK